MWRVRRRDEWKLGRNCVSNSFCQVSNNNGTSEVRKSSYICFTLQSSMTLNLILRRWSPSEQPLRHKQIVFQPPASHRLRPAHLVHPRGHGWGSKGAHRSVMRSGTATAFIWTGAHLCDTHLLHLKETRLSVENSYMLFYHVQRSRVSVRKQWPRGWILTGNESEAQSQRSTAEDPKPSEPCRSYKLRKTSFIELNVWIPARRLPENLLWNTGDSENCCPPSSRC